MTRVLLADDHALVREGIKGLLMKQTDIEVVGEAEDGVEALQKIKELVPDVAIIDVSMPNKDGIELIAELASLGLPTKTLVVSMYRNKPFVLRTLRAGADGFVWKGDAVTSLTRAIAEVQEGKRVLPDSFDGENLESENLNGGHEASRGLSKREFQVLCYLASGMTNRDVAQDLGISVKTVDTHRGHLLKKLALRNNADLARFAIRNGYVDA